MKHYTVYIALNYRFNTPDAYFSEYHLYADIQGNIHDRLAFGKTPMQLKAYGKRGEISFKVAIDEKDKIVSTYIEAGIQKALEVYGQHVEIWELRAFEGGQPVEDAPVQIIKTMAEVSILRYVEQRQANGHMV